MDAATYFQLHKVYFFAASGLIRIDLPLLLSVSPGEEWRKSILPPKYRRHLYGRGKDRDR